MPIISLDVYAPFEPTLPELAAQILQSNAMQHLHFDPGLTTVRISFASSNDQWFQDSRLLNRQQEPTFHANTIIGNKTATNLEIAYFVTETRNALEQLFSQIFPGTQYPQLPDRNKVTVVEMP
ncbi:hypothetical protein [Pseudorhodoferax sp. Leaf274]|uniref:hypothetical protein n=1 Tax=Pseudorhodoferax sp. Leaf274 TaxID=1736318 RepID=UPI00070365F5|nr:hypothetical protein [Pseudorhodoferax sp. Leaf274]KQP37198.1 hypothetical protein ASF44_15980 [Pseudorhodoferax sp. Leaf274]